MIKRSYFFSIIILILIIPSYAMGKDISKILLNKYKDINSIKTNFQQILKNRSTKEQEKRSGIIYIKKIKGIIKIRWETYFPEKEILIITKTNIWDYFPEEKLAYRYKLREIEQSKTILDLITGNIDIKNKFRIIKDQSDDFGTKYKLIPKNPEPNMVLVYLWLNKEDLITKIDIVDFFGNENIIIFKDTKINPNIDNDLFWKKPPSNVKILQGHPGIK